MKKSIIAAGAASVALAAMPIVGAFATPTPVRDITDVVQVELPLGCTMTVAPAASTTGDGAITTTTQYQSGGGTAETDIIGATYATTLAAGSQKTITGTAMTVVCNDTAGWGIYAVGVGDATGHVDYMDSDTNVDADDIPSSVAGGLDGDTSEWAFKIALSGTSASSYATIQNNGASGTYAVDSVIPTSSTEIVGHDGPIASDATVTVTPTYHVSFAPTQAGATYTGKVQYTLVHPES